MKFRKIASIILVASASMLLLTSCSKSATAPEANASSASAPDSDLVFEESLASSPVHFDREVWKQTGSDAFRSFDELQSFASGQLCTSIKAGVSNPELRQKIADWYSPQGIYIDDVSDAIIVSAKTAYCP
jgi:hypothetical protein